MTPSRLPDWPRLLRGTMAAAYVGMTSAHVVTHGLRKNAVNALLEAGCSTAETAAISGQSLGKVEHYARARNQDVLGGAAVLRWEAKNNLHRH